ncbi:interferon alpha-inducible protein 27, mitochondrial-like [Misgurnus anguillicaudatus]|uniref:interferon alpha-inducible protein 27, mitochondrial-like n=1 Tax=Misgurnus anguillicaudatus TaxID=75329 RepID=UPI003CCFB7B2
MFVTKLSTVDFHAKLRLETREQSSLEQGADYDMGLLKISSDVAGAGGAIAAAPLVLGAVGFTAAGVAAGSYAAGMMSAAAVANGGGVAAGSLVAILQAAGAAGIPVAAQAVVGAVGGGVATAAAILI